MSAALQRIEKAAAAGKRAVDKRKASNYKPAFEHTRFFVFGRAGSGLKK